MAIKVLPGHLSKNEELRQRLDQEFAMGYFRLLRAGSCDESVGEVGVDSQGLLDSELLHDDEAQAIHGAVVFVVIPHEIVEGFLLFLGRRPVDASENLFVEPAWRRPLCARLKSGST